MKTPTLTFIALYLLSPSFGFAQQSESKIRNVLFIVSDDLRANALGCYGNTVCQTPNIDKLAERAVVFDSAYCQGTVCGPSRTSFMYSRYKDKGKVTIGQHFRAHGRYSARVGKIFHMRVPGDIIAGTDGADVPETWTESFNSQGQEAHTPGEYACLNLNIFTTDEENRQSTKMPHRMFATVQYDGDGSDQPDHKTATKTIELLQQHVDEPFFIAAGFIRPHYPMVAPKQFFEPYPWKDISLPEQRIGDLDDIPKLGVTSSRSALNGIDKFPNNQKRMWTAYYAAVTFMDAQVGRILTKLDRLELRDSTAIVFTSDHGYHLGDHTFWQKNNLHEQVIRVPMIISAPGEKPGRSQSIVELVDLFPTLCDLTELPTPSDLHGTSLIPVLQNPTTTIKGSALSFAKGGTSLRTEKWAYVEYNDKTAELYDMQTDPGQFTNLATAAEHQATAQRLSKVLKTRTAVRNGKQK